MNPQQFQRLLQIINHLSQEEVDQFLTEAEEGMSLRESDNVSREEATRRSIEAQVRRGLISFSTPPGQAMEDMPVHTWPHLPSKIPKPEIPLPEAELDLGQVPKLVGRDKQSLFKDINEYIKQNSQEQ